MARYRRKSAKKNNRRRRRRTRKRREVKGGKRRRRRTRRKRGGMLYSIKLRANPSNYESILGDVKQGNTPLLNNIAKSLGHEWLCAHRNIRDKLDDLANPDQLKVTEKSCSN